MLKRFAHLAAAATLLASTVLAGDCLSGSSCNNECPLAAAANARISLGDEAVFVSGSVRDDFVASVLKGLESI